MGEKLSAHGSCARCRASLDLASVRVGDAWYCRAACAAGDNAPRVDAVAESALTNRPRRHYARREPKELRRRTA